MHSGGITKENPVVVVADRLTPRKAQGLLVYKKVAILRGQKKIFLYKAMSEWQALL